MEEIVTRFAPSPTGFLHMGNARTALFNWLYARHTRGKFILRIEDTDLARSTKASVDTILKSLEWMGIDWDEGPFFQSDRFDIYRQYIDALIDSGHAYYCTCSPEAIEAMRQKAFEAKGKPRYDGSCREKGLSCTDGAVVRFKSPRMGETVLDDVAKGHIIFQNSELDDFIISRSDGTPTYNFVVVVDDMTMGVNTVIRGDDHVMNTPKQILLYQALEHTLPTFCHVPTVLGSDRSRLSKRHGATSVYAYKEMGYLPDAFINYMVRLGWAHGDQEFFERDELIEKFSILNVGKSPGIFDSAKLLALNAEHIKKGEPKVLAKMLVSHLKAIHVQTEANDYLEKVVKTLIPRSKTLEEMASSAAFFFKALIEYDEKAAKKFLKSETLPILNQLISQLEQLPEPLAEKSLEDAFKAVMEATELKLGKIAQPVRVALTGTTVSPGIFEVIEILGKERVISRLTAATEFIRNQNNLK